MDCVKLVEDGIYKKEELSVAGQNFIGGIDECIEILDNYCDDEELEDEFSETLSDIKKEIIKSVIDDIKQILYITRCEHIVYIYDSEVCGADNGETEAGEK